MDFWQVMAIWTLIGFILIAVLPTPADRLRAGVFILLGGPLAWIVFAWLSLRMWIRGDI